MAKKVADRHSESPLRCHFSHDHILAPTEPIGINIIGVGGTGSSVLTMLVKMNLMLLNMDHPGLFVTAIDGDKVSKSNVGKQDLFYNEDVDRYKCEVLIERINLNTGFGWKFIPRDYTESSMKTISKANITIGCVDRIDPRINMIKFLTGLGTGFKDIRYEHRMDVPFYYIDCGNSTYQSQVICQTVRNIKQPSDKKNFAVVESLPGIIEIFGEEAINRARKTEDNTPSCSTMEALQRQDIMINPLTAMLACRIVWKLVYDKILTIHGYYADIEDAFNIKPIRI